MMGRKGSIGLPNKNIKKVLGRRIFEYPLIACKNSKKIDKIFVSTDCPVISRVIKKYSAIHISRPKRLKMNNCVSLIRLSSLKLHKIPFLRLSKC